MPNFVIDTSTSTSRSLAPGEYGAILEGGSLVVQANGIGVNNATLFNAGTIFTPNAAAVVGNGDVVLTNTANGSITGDWALLQLGGAATSYTLVNEGLMEGRSEAISLTSSANFFLTNTGTINGSVFNAINLVASNLVDITNDGTISTVGVGILINGAAEVRIVNAGLISADSAIFSGGSGPMTVLNTGTLVGGVSLGAGDDLFSGLSGDQTQAFVAGGGGNDTLLGGVLGDRMSGDGGNDQLRGMSGDDGLIGGDGNDNMRGGDGDDGMDGGIGDDRMRGNNGNDELIGGDGNDDLGGGDGVDDLFGGGGSDQLRGGTGDDALDGGSGSDTLAGGAGNDILTGGNNADVFEFGRAGGDDIITAFQNGADKMDLRAFHFSVAADVIALASTTSTGLSIDLTSKGGGEILIQTGLTLAQLDATDLIL